MSGGAVRLVLVLLLVLVPAIRPPAAAQPAAATPTRASQPASQVDAELLEFLGSLDLEGEEWTDFLAQHQISASVAARPVPPQRDAAPSGNPPARRDTAASPASPPPARPRPAKEHTP